MSALKEGIVPLLYDVSLGSEVRMSGECFLITLVNKLELEARKNLPESAIQHVSMPDVSPAPSNPRSSEWIYKSTGVADIGWSDAV